MSLISIAYANTSIAIQPFDNENPNRRLFIDDVTQEFVWWDDINGVVLFTIGGAGVTKDISYYRRVGSANNVYHTTPVGNTFSSFPHGADKIKAMPFIVNKNCTVDRIGINVVGIGTSPSTLIRLAIYEDDGNVFPKTLLLDSGDIPIGGVAGFKEAVVNQGLIAGKLYWLCYLVNLTGAGTVATVTVATPSANLQSGLGYDPTFSIGAGNQFACVDALFPYGAYPPLFPAGAYVGGGVPLVSVRFSA